MSSILRSLEKTKDGAYIIARKKRGLGVLFFFLIIGSFVSFVIGVAGFFFGVIALEAIVFGIVGLVLFGAASIHLIRYFKMPKIVITFKKGNFYIGKKIKCNPMKISDITVKRAEHKQNRQYENNQFREVQSTSGTLCFIANGEKHELDYLDEVEYVVWRMVKIQKEYAAYLKNKEKRENEQLAELQKPTEQTETINQTELSGEVEQPEQAEPVEQTVAIAEPESLEQPEHAENSEQIEESEEFEQEAFGGSFEQKELYEIANNIELPKMPDLPDLPD